MHQAVSNLTKAAVIANSDMGDDSGRVRNGLPSGAMHSARKVNLGRRNGLAMISLMGGDIASFAPETGPTGPVLESATVAAAPSKNEFHIEIVPAPVNTSMEPSLCFSVSVSLHLSLSLTHSLSLHLSYTPMLTGADI